MGALLVKYYEYVEHVAGREGKVKVAQMTRIASVVAAGTKEDPETLKRFRDAVVSVTGRPVPF